EAVQDMISQQQEILAAKRAIIDDLKRQIDELNEKRDKQKLVRNVSLAAGIIVGGAVGLSKARSTNAIDPILYGIIGTVIGLTGATVAAVDQVFFINTTTDKLDELAQNLEIAEKIL